MTAAARATSPARTPWLFFALPAVILLLRIPGLPTAAPLAHVLTATAAPAALQAAVHFTLFVPIGALVVTFCRLTLGLRALNVFSPILMALGFGAVGPVLGLGFLVVALGLVGLIIRPRLVARKLPYAARVPVLLSSAALLLLVPVVLAPQLDLPWLEDVAAYPVVALCLVCEKFARTLHTSGVSVTARRTAVTVTEALVIALIAGPLGGVWLFSHFPELLVAQIGCLMVVATHGDRRFFEAFASAPEPARHRLAPEPTRGS
jgi:7 transmembrane helices usually fused to an inactive transglutaminase